MKLMKQKLLSDIDIELRSIEICTQKIKMWHTLKRKVGSVFTKRVLTYFGENVSMNVFKVPIENYTFLERWEFPLFKNVWDVDTDFWIYGKQQYKFVPSNEHIWVAAIKNIFPSMLGPLSWMQNHIMGTICS